MFLLIVMIPCVMFTGLNTIFKGFFMKLIEAFTFPLYEMQTDNYTEWAKLTLVKDPYKNFWER